MALFGIAVLAKSFFVWGPLLLVVVIVLIFSAVNGGWKPVKHRL